MREADLSLHVRKPSAELGFDLLTSSFGATRFNLPTVLFQVSSGPSQVVFEAQPCELLLPPLSESRQGRRAEVGRALAVAVHQTARTANTPLGEEMPPILFGGF